MWIVAIGSFLVNRAMRLLALAMMAVNRAFSVTSGTTWHSGADKMLNNPFGLFLPAIIGPRWNCHALIGRIGPFDVRERIRIDAGRQVVAESWSAVVYDRWFRTVATFSHDPSVSSHECHVRPGRYSIFLRFYDPGGDIDAPAVHVDGRLLAAATRIADERQRYGELLDSIKGRKSLFYFWVHYYVFFLLRHRRWFPASLVKREFLPVGNPHTAFRFGHLPCGGSLDIACRPELLDQASVFLCVYNESSFPEAWTRIRSTAFSMAGINCAGAYLVRIVFRNDTANEASVQDRSVDRMIRVSVVR